MDVISGINKEGVSRREVYLLDEEDYLLDSEGNYLVEEVDEKQRRIRV